MGCRSERNPPTFGGGFVVPPSTSPTSFVPPDGESFCAVTVIATANKVSARKDENDFTNEIHFFKKPY